MNAFDQAARYAAKLEPPGFFRWLWRHPQPTWVFRDWLDTRTLPFPGEPDRTCDTVAGFHNVDAPGHLFAVVVEFQTRPHPDMLERLLEYAVRLRRELRPTPAGPDKYEVSAAFLT